MILDPVLPAGTPVFLSDASGRLLGRTTTEAGGIASMTIPPGGVTVTWLRRDSAEPDLVSIAGVQPAQRIQLSSSRDAAATMTVNGRTTGKVVNGCGGADATSPLRLWYGEACRGSDGHARAAAFSMQSNLPARISWAVADPSTPSTVVLPEPPATPTPIAAHFWSQKGLVFNQLALVDGGVRLPLGLSSRGSSLTSDFINTYYIPTEGLDGLAFAVGVVQDVGDGKTNTRIDLHTGLPVAGISADLFDDALPAITNASFRDGHVHSGMAAPPGAAIDVTRVLVDYVTGGRTCHWSMTARGVVFDVAFPELPADLSDLAFPATGVFAPTVMFIDLPAQTWPEIVSRLRGHLDLDTAGLTGRTRFLNNSNIVYADHTKVLGM